MKSTASAELTSAENTAASAMMPTAGGNAAGKHRRQRQIGPRTTEKLRARQTDHRRRRGEDQQRDAVPRDTPLDGPLRHGPHTLSAAAPARR